MKVKSTVPVSCPPTHGACRWSPQQRSRRLPGGLRPHHPSGSHVSGTELGVSTWDTGTSLLTLGGEARAAEASGPAVVFLREPPQEPRPAAPRWLQVGGVRRMDGGLQNLAVGHVGLMSASAGALPFRGSPEVYFHAHRQPTSSTNVSAETGFVYWTWL